MQIHQHERCLRIRPLLLSRQADHVAVSEALLLKGVGCYGCDHKLLITSAVDLHHQPDAVSPMVVAANLEQYTHETDAPILQ